MPRISAKPKAPEKVSMSLAAAMALRIAPGRFYRDASTGCVNLLTTDDNVSCSANCSYCGLAREREADENEKTFIRVGWPQVKVEEVLKRLDRYQDRLTRVCISMQNTAESLDHTLWLTREIKANTEIPISALIMPPLCKNRALEEMKKQGADMVGIGIDAASERVFELRRGEKVRGGLKWSDYMDAIIKAADIFGHRKANAHIVVGLGETDRELALLFDILIRHGVRPFLFSFYPEPGSRMEKARRPSLKRYRMLKLVKYLMEEGRLSSHMIKCDDSGKIIGTGMSWDDVDEVIEDGSAFMTDGCSKADGSLACNRPFGGYRPGEAFRDFPFLPLAEDKMEIRRSLKMSEVFK